MRLLLTRPEPDAARSADALTARGHVVLVAPLMRMVPLEADLSGAFDAVVMTSANAVRAVGPGFAKALPAFTVGQRTAQAAREAGFANVHSADGALADLVTLIAQRGPARLLYLAGEDRAGDLAGALAPHGIAVETRVVYRASAVAALPPEALRALQAGSLDGVLHYSRRSAETLVRLAREAGCLNAVVRLAHYCLSEEVAVPLRGAGVSRISVASRPDEATLIGLI
jgi:uroporphyrinogen-III synthase